MTGHIHPVFGTEDTPPATADDISELEAHLARRNHIAGILYHADARATITLAKRARHRIIRQPTIGMLVYYNRRLLVKSQRGHLHGYRGPARVIAVEPSEHRNAPSVVWMSHGGDLIRGAPEHLLHVADSERAA